MHAEPGDWLIVASSTVDHQFRRGYIAEVPAQDGTPPYRVRWTDDDRTTLVFPGPDARVLDEHQLAEFDRAHAKRAFSQPTHGNGSAP